MVLAVLCLAVLEDAAGQSANGTPAEAKAMIERAAAVLKANKTKALIEFNDPRGAFRDRDLYVFCSDLNGNITAHPESSLIGAPMTAFVDLDGKRLGLEIMNAAVEGKISEVEYKFPKNGTLVPVEKNSFVVKVADQICGVGYYK
jgi:signal transduction histidine kinase